MALLSFKIFSPELCFKVIRIHRLAALHVIEHVTKSKDGISIMISASKGPSLPNWVLYLNFSQISGVKLGLSVMSKNLSREISSVQSSSDEESVVSVSCNFLPPFCDRCNYVRIAKIFDQNLHPSCRGWRPLQIDRIRHPSW